MMQLSHGVMLVTWYERANKINKCFHTAHKSRPLGHLEPIGIKCFRVLVIFAISPQSATTEPNENPQKRRLAKEVTSRFLMQTWRFLALCAVTESVFPFEKDKSYWILSQLHKKKEFKVFCS